MPSKANPTDACYDLYVPDDVILRSGRQVIDLRFSLELPSGYAAIIKPRSGFSSKGIEVQRYNINGGSMKLMDESFRLDADVLMGTVDAKYRDNVGVILKVWRYVYFNERFVLPKGTRIAQMQIQEIPDTEIVEVDELDMTDNRGGGFGHTGSR